MRLGCVQSQQGRVSTASISQGGRHLLQTQKNQGTQQQTPASPTSTAPAPVAPVQQGQTPAAAGLKSGYFGSGPFNNKVYSQSASTPVNGLGLKSGNQYIVTVPNIGVGGTARWDPFLLMLWRHCFPMPSLCTPCHPSTHLRLYCSVRMWSSPVSARPMLMWSCSTGSQETSQGLEPTALATLTPTRRLPTRPRAWMSTLSWHTLAPASLPTPSR